ncbi:MAG: hypothetical protein AAGI44_09540 [Pseudomonadota bacterium]
MELTEDHVDKLHSYAHALTVGELPAGWNTLRNSSPAIVAHNAQQRLFYKEFAPRRPVERLTALVYGSPVERLCRQNRLFSRAGINVPETLTWGTLPNGNEYLFTREAAGHSLHCWLCERLVEADQHTAMLRRRLLDALGVFTGRLHASGFLPGDMSVSEIYAEKIEDRFRFTLLNNGKAVKRMPPPGRLLLENLIEINMLPPNAVSHSDRMRVFASWKRQMRELSPIETKLLASAAYQGAMLRMQDALK